MRLATADNHADRGRFTQRSCRPRNFVSPNAPQQVYGQAEDAEIILAKNRNGPTGVFELYFEAEQARFFSKAREDDLPV